MNRYLTPFLIILVSSAIYVGYVQGVYADIQGSLLRKEELKLDIIVADNAQSELSRFASEVAGFPPGGEERIKKMVPDRVDMVRLIVDVDALAQNFGLTIKNPRVTSKDRGEDSVAEYDEHLLSFSVAAPYPIFRSFLHGMEDSLALRDTLKISFKGNEQLDSGEINKKMQDPSLIVYVYQVELASYSLRTVTAPVATPTQ